MSRSSHEVQSRKVFGRYIAALRVYCRPSATYFSVLSLVVCSMWFVTSEPEVGGRASSIPGVLLFSGLLLGLHVSDRIRKLLVAPVACLLPRHRWPHLLPAVLVVIICTAWAAVLCAYTSRPGVPALSLVLWACGSTMWMGWLGRASLAVAVPAFAIFLGGAVNTDIEAILHRFVMGAHAPADSILLALSAAAVTFWFVYIGSLRGEPVIPDKRGAVSCVYSPGRSVSAIDTLPGYSGDGFRHRVSLYRLVLRAGPGVSGPLLVFVLAATMELTGKHVPAVPACVSRWDVAVLLPALAVQLAPLLVITRVTPLSRHLALEFLRPCTRGRLVAALSLAVATEMFGAWLKYLLAWFAFVLLFRRGLAAIDGHVAMTLVSAAAVVFSLGLLLCMAATRVRLAFSFGFALLIICQTGIVMEYMPVLDASAAYVDLIAISAALLVLAVFLIVIGFFGCRGAEFG